MKTSRKTGFFAAGWLLGILFLLPLPAQVLACSCLYQGRFAEFANDHPVIVRATVLSLNNPLPFIDRDTYRTMTVRVNEVIRGEPYDGEMVFTGDSGNDCLTYITGSQYAIGSEHLFVTGSLFPEQPLLGCGEPSVRILGDRVTGVDLDRPLQPVYTMALNELLEQLASP